MLNPDFYAEHSFTFFNNTVLVSQLFVNSGTGSAMQLQANSAFFFSEVILTLAAFLFKLYLIKSLLQSVT